MQQAFAVTIRIYHEDTDAGGVVYYANYLKFMERARTEWLRALGFEQDELAHRDRVMFVVRSAKIEFLKPARFNDLIDVAVVVATHRGASLAFAHTIQRRAPARRAAAPSEVAPAIREELLCEADVRVACIDAATHAPRALPATLAARLKEVRP